MEIISNSI